MNYVNSFTELGRGLFFTAIEENSNICGKCGKELENFVHNCPDSNNVFVFYGCIVCDNYCNKCEPKKAHKEVR